MSDLDTITATLRSLKVGGASRIRSGHFTLTSKFVSAPDEALQELNSLDGTGWVWIASEPEVMIMDQGQKLSNPSVFIEYAERVSADGSHSVAIALEGMGTWRVTIAYESEPLPEDAIIVPHAFLRRGARDLVRHEVLWEPDAEGMLRPTASRFVGFGPK